MNVMGAVTSSLDIRLLNYEEPYDAEGLSSSFLWRYLVPVRPRCVYKGTSSDFNWGHQTVKTLFVALLFSLTTIVWAGDYENARLAESKGDYKTAFIFYKKAAVKGDSAAQAKLAWLYGEGLGVLQDYGAAYRWNKLAAVQGNTVAQINLGVAYENGEGIVQDSLKAHMWMNLAAAAGNKTALEGRDFIAKKLTPRQISKAQVMAKKCLASNYMDCD